MKLKGKHPRGRPKSRWKQLVGKMSGRRKEEHGKTLIWSFGKTEIDEEIRLLDDPQ
jgi:hypothetical protein